MHSAQSAREVVDFLLLETPDFIPPDPNIPDLNQVDYKIWVIMKHRVYQTKICSMDERLVIDFWCGLESTIDNGIDDYERASIRKEDN